jgi:hypothetical protein
MAGVSTLSTDARSVEVELGVGAFPAGTSVQRAGSARRLSRRVIDSWLRTEGLLRTRPLGRSEQHDGLIGLEDELSDLELRSTEVDQECIALTRSPEITENLCDMLPGERLAGLHFNYQAVLHEKVGYVVSEGSSVLVQHIEGLLLNHIQPALLEAMGKPVLIDPVEMPVSKVRV